MVDKHEHRGGSRGQSEDEKRRGRRVLITKAPRGSGRAKVTMTAQELMSRRAFLSGKKPLALEALGTPSTGFRFESLPTLSVDGKLVGLLSRGEALGRVRTREEKGRLKGMVAKRDLCGGKEVGIVKIMQACVVGDCRRLEGEATQGIIGFVSRSRLLYTIRKIFGINMLREQRR
ncbi:MAG: hypothetical protein OXF02_01610 [Simkaniaceae bacterium]|nr:hypothetical protein [Simkaniaceae bacterium]